MDKVYHAKEEEGVFFGEFSYLDEGVHAGSFEAKCSQACLNIILQKEKFTEGLAVIMDDQALEESIEALHIRNYFGIPQSKEMQDLFLVNWREGYLDIFGSLIALYHVLKAEQLNLFPLTATLHPVVSAVGNQLEIAKGYLYFLNNHWMVFRQMGNNWYKFDPWLGGAQLFEHSYVALYIKQLIKDGMLVFLIDGVFPACPADIVIEELEVPEYNEEPELLASLEEPGKPSVDMTEVEIQEGIRLLDLLFEGEDNELAYACLISLEDEMRRKREEEEFERLTVRENTAEASSSNENTSSHTSAPQQEALATLIKRKNGTTVTPLIDLESTSTSHPDQPFNLIIDEKGDGVKCFDSPANVNESVTDSNCKENDQEPKMPTVSQPAPSSRIYITSSDVSAFRKVISTTEDDNKGVKDEEEGEMCCVCWSVPPSHVVVPCGHFCLCSECVVSIQKPEQKTQCPLCKQETSTIVKLYK